VLTVGCGTGPAAPGAAGTPAPGSTASAATAGQRGACDLVTPADIRSALGVAPDGPGTSRQVGVLDACDWNLAGGSRLRVAVFASADAQTLTTAGTATDPAWQAVAGLGRQAGFRAFNFAPQVAVAEVEVVLRTRSVLVQVTGSPGQVPGQGALVELARRVVSRAS
jgi:hypothetical protein